MTGPSCATMIERKLLVINPNTNGQVTQRIRDALAGLALPGLEIEVANPDHGPFAIETRADRQAAIPHVMALIGSRRKSPADGYVLACFDDIAISQIRAMGEAPAISMAEAAIREAVGRGAPFTIVTTVHQAIAGIEILRERYGASGLSTIRAAGIGVADASAEADGAEARLCATIERAIAEDRAQAIVLGSGAFVGRAGMLEKQFGVPFIDGLEVAIGSLARPWREGPRAGPGSSPQGKAVSMT